MVETELESLRIDRQRKRSASRPPRWSSRWIIIGAVMLVAVSVASLLYGGLVSATEVEVAPVAAAAAGSREGGTIILNATGYIVPAYKIEVASKVTGRVASIEIEKGDKVQEGQVLARLEDEEYRAQLDQSRGQLMALEARLAELEHGSRPEEISRADADLQVARADLENARISLTRTRQLVTDGVLPKQALDDSQARHDAQAARVASLDRVYQLTRVGPRKEQIDAVRGQIVQARGAIAFSATQLANTVIKAPVAGTILERAVEKGEFVTTSFVGERGAKGYVATLADLTNLKVELDINQSDFAKLGPRQRATITTDAFPDRQYDGVIDEISPEANRQKATVQVKVKILKPDDYLRPEMNANVAFYAEERRSTGGPAAAAPILFVPASAVHDEVVFVVLEGRAQRRAVKSGGVTSQGIRIVEGLRAGEEIVVNPPADLADGAKVRAKRK
jgi:HlyD family secretion protein